MRLEEINASLVNRAIEIYLNLAYEDEALRNKHSIRFDSEEPIEKILEAFDREDEKRNAFELRLGCQHYPHLKMALWEAYIEGEYVFAVDRHDGFSFNQKNPGVDGWNELKTRNFRVKRKIEEAWYDAGLPTLRRIKEHKLSCSDILREFSGHEVLLVDNDRDATSIMAMILEAEGYGCRRAENVGEVRAVIEDPEARKSCGMALVDVLLGDGSGLDVIRLIRANDDMQQIPVVLTSAMNPSEVDLQDTDGYLRKPYTAQSLLDTVNRVLRQRYDGHESFLDKPRANK